PNNPPPAPPEPLLPPQPLLPAHPPGAPYTPPATYPSGPSGTERIPTQRPAPDLDTVRVAGGGQPDERDSRPRHGAEAEEETERPFEWLRPARSNPANDP